MNLKWISLIVFMVSGSVMWQQMSGTHHADHHNPDDNHNHPHHEMMNLPPELQREYLSDTTSSSTTTTMLRQNPIIPVDTCQEEYDRATADRTPGLTMDDLERARALVGNRHRLANVAETLRVGEKPITAVVCGGSITLGHGVVPYVSIWCFNNWFCWVALFILNS